MGQWGGEGGGRMLRRGGSKFRKIYDGKGEKERNEHFAR